MVSGTGELLAYSNYSKPRKIGIETNFYFGHVGIVVVENIIMHVHKGSVHKLQVEGEWAIWGGGVKIFYTENGGGGTWNASRTLRRELEILDE